MSIMITVETNGYSVTVHQIESFAELPDGFARLYSGGAMDDYRESVDKYIQNHGFPAAVYLHVDSQQCYKLFCFQGEVWPGSFVEAWQQATSLPIPEVG